MGLVIDYIIQSSDGEVKVYDSQKRFIDEAENDTFGEFDDHINEVTIKDKSLLYAEDKPFKESQKKIDPDLIRKNTIRAYLNIFWMVLDKFIKLEI